MYEKIIESIQPIGQMVSYDIQRWQKMRQEHPTYTFVEGTSLSQNLLKHAIKTNEEIMEDKEATEDIKTRAGEIKTILQAYLEKYSTLTSRELAVGEWTKTRDELIGKLISAADKEETKDKAKKLQIPYR